MDSSPVWPRVNLPAVARPILLLWIGSVVSASLAFLLQVAIARKLSPEHYGALSAVITVIAMLSPLASMGITGLWLKVHGTEGAALRKWFGPSCKVMVIGSILCVLVLATWAATGPHDRDTASLFVLLFPVLLGNLVVEVILTTYQIQERYFPQAMLQVAPNAIRVASVALLGFLYSERLDSWLVSLAYSATALLLIVFGLTQLRSFRRLMRGGSEFTNPLRPLWPEDGQPPKAASITSSHVFRQALPFATATAFHLIYFQANIVIIKYMLGDHGAGLYSVAFTLVLAVYLLPGAIFQKYLIPKLHRWAEHDRARLLRAYRSGNVAMLVAGVAIGAFMFSIAESLIFALFGAAYSSATNVLKILSLCIPLRFISSSIGAPLVTSTLMKFKSSVMGAVAVLSVILNICLISTFGLLGAAAATLLCELILLVAYFLLAERYLVGADASTVPS